jgi:hypothetical protein
MAGAFAQDHRPIAGIGDSIGVDIEEVRLAKCPRIFIFIFI